MNLYRVYPEPMFILISFLGLIGYEIGKIGFVISSFVQSLINCIIAYLLTTFVLSMWFSSGTYLVVNDINLSFLIYIGATILTIYIVPFLVIGSGMLMISAMFNWKD